MFVHVITPLTYCTLTVCSSTYMRNRRRAKLGWTLLFHNATMVLSYIYALVLSCFVLYKLSNHEDVQKDLLPQLTLYTYIFTRFREMLDTAVMISRKRGRQITTIHVLRRASATFCITLMSSISIQTFLICATDSFLQVFVYVYYSLSCIGLGFFARRYKHYITKLALVAYATIAATSQM